MSGSNTQFVGALAARLQKAKAPSVLGSMVLRIDSAQAYDLIAYNATEGKRSFEALVELVTRAGPQAAQAAVNFRPVWLLEAGRIAALRRSRPDPVTGLAFFDLVRDCHGLAAFNQESLELYAQLLLLLDRDRLTDLLPEFDLSPSYRWSIELDAINPFVRAGDSENAWLAKLNTVFAAGDLEPVSLSWPAEAPFDRLAATPSSSVDDADMVTVIMSAYQPDQSIYTAVNSILNQSWRNLELLVVNDASPDSYRGVLTDVADMDERVRVLNMPVNGGTYMVRNFAFDHAQGEFVTFQDSDDWSHPRRLERQVAALRADDRLLATRSWSVRAFSDLTFTYLGYPPDRMNASSLLFRRRPVIDLIGYFDTVRKSADMEYPERLQAAAPGSLRDLSGPIPLAINQLRSASLSRTDIFPGWTRWTRIAYRDAFRVWHKQIKDRRANARYDGDPETRPVPLPDPSWSPHPSVADPHRQYDIVIINDWRRSRGSHRGALTDISSMIDDGLRVAVAHAETLDPPPSTPSREAIARPIQELINTSVVDLIHLTQPIVTRLVMVYDPMTLQFLPGISPRLRAQRVAVLADTADDSDGVESRYWIPTCADNAERLFARRPIWVPRNPASRVVVADMVDPIEVSEFDLEQSFDFSRLTVSTRRLASARPVIGRHVRDHWSRWPATRKELLAAYPDDDRIDVRLLGGHRTPLKVLGDDHLPPNWISFSADQVDARSFLAQLDFFVYFYHPKATMSPEVAVAEALGSGCVAVLSQHCEPIFGDGAVYCDEHEVSEIVTALHGSPDDYRRQQQRGRRLIQERYNTRAFREGLTRLLSS